uniref:RING-type E3 ubiquitin transferase n=1 Tax=Chelonoidis abingdonii TaxID=106734 RepID=A0A8C0FW58_CHEAB
MASSLSGLDIQEEATCPICLEYLTDPVSVDCGHNFCRGCITQYCAEWVGCGSLTCPICRSQILKGNFRPNWQLRNLTLDLFCEEDGEAVCVVCERSSQHRSHTVLLIEEAAQNYKEKIQAHLKTLKEEREKLLGLKATGEGKSQEYLRQKIVSEFQQLRQFLEEQERLLLAQLEKLDEEILRIQKENVTKLSGEISHLSELIHELEGKCQKPASEFLQVRLSLKHPRSMCRDRRAPESCPLESSSQRSQCNCLLHMTLDPDTAHPQLILSEDGKTVRYGHLWNKLPNTTKRFDYERCVLGSEGFTMGKHCWEVEVGEQGGWAVGVARESLRRKGEISFKPKGGIWAVEYWEGQYWALTDPLTPLPLSWVPRRIRIYLDYEQGQMAFFNADNESLIFTFPPASFSPHLCNSSCPFSLTWPSSQVTIRVSPFLGTKVF